MITDIGLAKLESEHMHAYDEHGAASLDHSIITPCSSYGKASSKSERRKSRYIYDYSRDKLERVKDGDDFFHQKGIKEIPIPMKPGRLPIHMDGTENIPAFINISAELRFLRWIGAQDKLYVVGSCEGISK